VHAVCLIGEPGAGKYTLARGLAAQLLDYSPDKLDNYPYFAHIKAAKDSIGIEDMRKLKQFLSLKTTGKGSIRRIILIEDAETMTNEAQNAFLKFLEEPPTDSIIILTTSDVNKLLPTIQSRLQFLQVLPLEQVALEEIASQKGFTDQKFERAYLLSQGNIGLFTALTDSHQEHPLVEAIAQAKSLLGMQQFERLQLVDELSKSSRIDLLLLALERIAAVSVRQAVQKADTTAISRWTAMRKVVLAKQEALKNNANNKLLLDDLLLSL
jgi:DNA polymerase III delta prime subunit